MDRVTEAMLADFVQSQELKVNDSADAFERFANYCVISREFSDSFDVEDVSTGSGNDTGIDGIAITVNGVLVTSAEEVNDLANRNGYLDVRFIFCQAKTSSNFNAADIGTFTFGVSDFFSEKPRLPRNEMVAGMAEVQDAVYKRSAQLTKGKPACHLYYVTTGRWQDDANLVARFSAAREELKDLQLFDEVTCEPVDADGIQKLYQTTKNKAKAEFVFATKAVLPDMAGIDQAYLGVIPAKEYLRLIKDEVGNVKQSLFYDNVRDFQDYNEVNKEIRATLQSAGKDRFAVMNNGVTLVAKSLQAVGNRFIVEDYQIVNGCQTSHVLFDNETWVGDQVYVPLKVIVTADEEITNSIITAANRQTQVKRDQLLALSDVQKKLEDYFQSYKDKQRLYYERRSKQYAQVNGIEKVRIVTAPQQIRAFASMFLDEPHRASRYYSELLSLVGDRIFGSQHRLEPYYTSAYALYKLEYLFRNGQLDQRFRPARYHLLVILRYQVGGENLPPMTANKMDDYCQAILRVLWDDDKAVASFAHACKAIEAVSGVGAAIDRDKVKTQTFTDAVLAQARKA